jgi:thioredoxin type arsenate reductase
VSESPIRVLFVCTGNSARSQLAEALLEQLGGPDFAVESGGTMPKGVNPYTIRVLAARGIDWSGAESKSVDAFVGDSFDYVVTVCDRARQSCPVFPGQYNSLHWDLEDPSEVEGTDAEKLAAFERTAVELDALLVRFVGVALQAVGISGRSEVAG